MVTSPAMHRPALTLLLACSLASPASAADPDHTGVVETGGVRIELQVSPRAKVSETRMVFQLSTADGSPIATAKAQGHAEFSSGGLKGRATLHPDGEHRLVGYGLMSDRADLRIVATITVPGRPPVTARFEPRKLKP